MSLTAEYLEENLTYLRKKMDTNSFRKLEEDWWGIFKNDLVDLSQRDQRIRNLFTTERLKYA